MINTQLACEYKKQYDAKSPADKMNIYINNKQNRIEMDFSYTYDHTIYKMVAFYDNMKPNGDYVVSLNCVKDYSIVEELMPFGAVQFQESNKVREMNIMNMFCAAQDLVNKMREGR
jgi:hypothetical protein